MDPGVLELLDGPGPCPGIQLDLPEAHDGRRDLDALIVGDVLQRLLEREAAGRGEADGVVGRRGPHVGELLLPTDVHVHVLGPGVLPDDHPTVDLLGRTDEEGRTLLEPGDGVRRGHAPTIGNDASALADPQVAHPWLPALEDVVEHPGTAGFGQELGPEADEGPRGHHVVQADPAGAVVGHVVHAGLALAQQLGHGADVLLGDVHG